MESYERMEQDMFESKKNIKMNNDIMYDSKKWDILSKYSENIEDKENYKKLSETLYNMFMEQHQKIMQMFKNE